MPIVAVITAVAAERDAVADGVGSPQAVRLGPYDARRCETPTDDIVVVAGGVGPAAAAAAAAFVVATQPVRLLVSAGVGGSFASAGLRPGDVAVASTIVAADLGAMSPERFLDLSALGLDGGAAVAVDPALVDAMHSRLADAGIAAAVGPILTLSTATGTTTRAAELMARHGAVAEAMEGAGVAHVAVAHGLPVVEVRVISNEVGDRDRASWDLLGALDTLTRVARVVLADRLAATSA
ncbi:MAG: futalosine hydrolase [Mycobacteriales bacterium]|nr:futalosine hydrolase [Frankia sp.]